METPAAFQEEGREKSLGDGLLVIVNHILAPHDFTSEAAGLHG